MSTLAYWEDRETGKAARFKPEQDGHWEFDEDDYLLLALIADPLYCAELLGEDPSNVEYAGQFVVRDYQFPLFRVQDNYTAFACGRSTGKTESIKWKAVAHAFRRIGHNLLLTAPELIHLLPLADAIEDKVNACRLTREFLDCRGGKTGFTHRPFGVNYVDGTKVVGRIPRLSGVGVKGQHQPDLIIDEAQDYPEAGWVEVNETVMREFDDFTYTFYGVHSGDRSSGFHKRTTQGGFQVVQVTGLQRPDWNERQKQAAKAAYGGTSAPDYRRNILGEAGAASSPFFVTARLVACMDQDRESEYNQRGYAHQQIRVEEFEELGMPMAEHLDLPHGLREVWGGMDLGLTDSPTVITLFSREQVKREPRLKLVRRITMERMRTRQIREALYAIAHHFGPALHGFGMDITGLGFPIWQEIEDDEAAPAHLLEVARGYFFNAKAPVGVDVANIARDSAGTLKDQFGSAVREETDPLTGQTRYISFMPMIEASTRYLREMVDSTYMLLPFDAEITSDMQGETVQRIRRIAGLKKKPNAFHILDSMRAMAMAYRAEEVEQGLALPEQVAVLDLAY